MSESIRHDKISVRQIMRDLRELSVRDLTPEARLDKSGS